MEPKIIVIYDAATGNVETREMTDDEYAEWQAVAAANPPLEETRPEVVPASDDAGAPSIDAG